ncbi:MAG: ABC transporter permease [Anaerolineaceae bacterium]|nr:ABC transporter permease [Anaerolineaceae bacterium]
MEPTLSAVPASQSLSHTTLGAELRAFRMVVWREWAHFIRYPSWIFALLIWPIIFPSTYILSARALSGPDGSGLGRFLQTAGTENFLGYIVIGTLVWMWQNTILWNVGFALRGEQMRGTLESNWLSPTWRFSFLLGVSPVQVIIMLVFIVVSILEFSLFFGLRFNANLLSLLLVVLASLPSLYGIGFVFASLVIAAREAGTLVQLVRGLVMIFCGITYPLSVMPIWMQSFAEWLPPTLIIRAGRAAALTAAPPAALQGDLLKLLLFGAFWLITGYLAFSFMERRASRRGTVGQF